LLLLFLNATSNALSALVVRNTDKHANGAQVLCVHERFVVVFLVFEGQSVGELKGRDLQPELVVGEKVGNLDGIAGQGAGSVLANPFNDGEAFESMSKLVAKGLAHQLKRERAQEFIWNIIHDVVVGNTGGSCHNWIVDLDVCFCLEIMRVCGGSFCGLLSLNSFGGTSCAKPCGETTSNTVISSPSFGGVVGRL